MNWFKKIQKPENQSMGNKPSTVFPCLQPSLPCSQYDYQQPLLNKDNHHKVFDSQESILKCMEQMKFEIEANRKKSESLEEKNMAMEKELGEARTAIFKLESKVTTVEEEKNVTISPLEEEILELKYAISKLESRSRPAASVPRLVESDDPVVKEVDVPLTDQEWRIQRWLETKDET